MKHHIRFLSVLLLLLIVAGGLLSCDSIDPILDGGEESDEMTSLPPFEDYASGVKLDMASSTAKIEGVKVKQFIDGDTTHFHVPKTISDTGVLKARYIAINTPESTGQIEEWGKLASQYTRQKLESAASILLESDTATWNVDSTGDRYLVWVWYRAHGASEYRNLNVEILQEGLAIASNSSQNRYGTYCMSALNQAKRHQLYVHSGEKDPDFYYGNAIELTLKELRVNATLYAGKTVAFEGVVTKNDGQSVYVEEFDEETNMYHGIAVYYGFSLNGGGLNVIKPGNRVRIVGSMQFYEAGGTYQVADLDYDMMDPKNPNNIQKLGSGYEAAYFEVSPETFAAATVSVTVVTEEGEEELKSVPFAELALSTSISMKDLTVQDIYVTDNDGKSDGAMTLTCTANGYTISVRTTVLTDANGDLVTPEYFEGKVIDVKGIVDYYSGKYQIKVFSLKDITIH